MARKKKANTREAVDQVEQTAAEIVPRPKLPSATAVAMAKAVDAEWVEVNVVCANVATTVGKLYSGATAALPRAEAEFLAARDQVRIL